MTFHQMNDRNLGNRSAIVLTEMHNRCPSKIEKEALRQYFEKEFIHKLRDEPVGKSTVVDSVWSASP